MVKFLAVAAAAGACIALLAGAACGRDEAAEELRRVAALRARQARSLATQAGLSKAAADVLADAAGSVAATYTATYEAGDGRITVMADPPRRRVDTSAPGQPDHRTVADGRQTYVCTRVSGKWSCQVGPAGDQPGAFRPDSVASTVAALTGPGTPPITVATKRVAGAKARCLAAGAASFCVSASGVPLLIEGVEGSDVRATTYRTNVTEGAFDRPDEG